MVDFLIPIIIFIIIFFIIIFLEKSFKFDKAKSLGKKGEKEISSILNTLDTEYFVFNDIYLKFINETVQIDHIILSTYGIFIIETKNYNGWIYGTDSSEFWIKNMYGKKYKFRNPLKQNISHMIALKKLFKLPENKFIPIVVFLENATLKCKTEGLVIYSFELKKFIESYTIPILDKNTLHEIKNKLQDFSNTDKNIEKEHIKNIQKKINSERKAINNNTCPKCGGILVKRKGPYGPFIGCSNYPKCKFTK